tara:strand:+ start:5555 stop:6295 length:741 start_codon:yes stop_codon:yes gene_type:complete
MKLAICFSGIVRGTVGRNVNNVKKAMPEADFFYATWEERQNENSKMYKCKTYPEPKLHYNSWTECIVDNPHHKYAQYKHGISNKVGGVYNNESLNHSTKQILAHAYQVKDLPEEYDMIVRIRWDTVCGSLINFTKYVEQSYKENIAIGFSIRGGRHTELNKFVEIPKIYATLDTDISVSRDWCWWLNDNLIIHPRKKFNPDKVLKLHEEKKLWPAEYGWYQALSENDDHLCVYGGAAIERFVRSKI